MADEHTKTLSHLLSGYRLGLPKLSKMLPSFSLSNFENYPQKILSKILPSFSNFENFQENLENPQKFSKYFILRAVGIRGAL